MDAQLTSAMILAISIFLLAVLIFVVCGCFWRRLGNIEHLLYEKYVSFDPKIDQLVDLAIDHWRLSKHIQKIIPALTAEDARRLTNSLRRIESYLRENDIEVVDYSGRSANSGMNVDIVSVEKDAAIRKPTVKETVSPAVLYKGVMRKKSQVIILDNLKNKEENDNE